MAGLGLLVFQVGDSRARSTLAVFALAKAIGVPNLAISPIAVLGASLFRSGVSKSTDMSLVARSGLAVAAVAMPLPSLSGAAILKSTILLGLVVCTVIRFRPMPDLALPAEAKFMALPKVVSRAGNSVPVSRLDVFWAAKLMLKVGLVLPMAANCLDTSALVVSWEDKLITALALWAPLCGLGRPLERDFPLPGEVLVCPGPSRPSPTKPGELWVNWLWKGKARQEHTSGFLTAGILLGTVGILLGLTSSGFPGPSECTAPPGGRFTGGESARANNLPPACVAASLPRVGNSSQ